MQWWRRLRRSGALLVVIALGVALLAGGSGVLAAQDEPAPSDEDLVDDLVEIEDALAGVALLPDVDVSDDTTWGDFTGNFVGNAVLLEQIDSDLETLVAEASDSSTEVAEAVEQIASAWRTVAQGYAYLAAFERADLAAPPTGEDEADGGITPTSDVEEARGHAEAGTSLLLQALPAFSQGYVVLQNTEAAADDDQTLFEARFTAAQQAARDRAAAARLALSYPVSQLLVDAERYTSESGDPAPETVVRYVCVDTEDYLEQRSQGVVSDLTIPEGEVSDLPIADCPALDSGENEVRVVAAE